MVVQYRLHLSAISKKIYTYRPGFKVFDTSARKPKYTIGKLSKNATIYMNCKSGAGVEPGQTSLTLYPQCKFLDPIVHYFDLANYTSL